MNTELNKVDSLIADLIADTAQTKRAAMTMAAFLKTGKAKKFVAMAKEMDGETISSYIYTSGTAMYVSLHVTHLDGFKDARLAGILDAFEFMNPDSNVTDDYAAGYSRTFRFVYNFRSPDALTIVVYATVEAKINADSTTCERVVVGMTKPKAMPIYKLVCDGQEVPEVIPELNDIYDDGADRAEGDL